MDKTISPARRRNNRKGLFAEILVSFYLLLKGYRILARRYRSHLGEIDIIALRGNRLAFVEVKHRSNLEKALGALSRYQEKRIIESAKYWLSKNKYYLKYNIYFDYVILIPWSKPKHFKGYFRE